MLLWCLSPLLRVWPWHCPVRWVRKTQICSCCPRPPSAPNHPKHSTRRINLPRFTSGSLRPATRGGNQQTSTRHVTRAMHCGRCSSTQHTDGVAGEKSKIFYSIFELFAYFVFLYCSVFVQWDIIIHINCKIHSVLLFYYF